jgi:hypothetical protein
MNTYSFSDHSATAVDQWFNEADQSGQLANYLLDPQEFFMDGVTVRLTESLVKILRKNVGKFR